MNKTAWLFAGQGAQMVGMGKDLAERHRSAAEWFARADATLGYSLSSIIWQGPEDELTRTDHAQPAIFLVGWVAFQLLQERLPGLPLAAAAGLSLGEFTALAAAGAMSFDDGLKLVRQRGQFMQAACAERPGSMAAIIGLDQAALQSVCAEAEVETANLNCPGQIVISGETDKINRACELAKARGAKRAVPLSVAGAYHSRLMASAQAKLEAALRAVEIRAPGVPVISNVTARPHGGPAEVRALLVRQVTSPVRWEDSMRHLLTEGFASFIELGPGTVLSGFMKRIERNARVLNVADVPSLEAAVNALS